MKEAKKKRTRGTPEKEPNAKIRRRGGERRDEYVIAYTIRRKYEHLISREVAYAALSHLERCALLRVGTSVSDGTRERIQFYSQGRGGIITLLIRTV